MIRRLTLAAVVPFAVVLALISTAVVVSAQHSGGASVAPGSVPPEYLTAIEVAAASCDGLTAPVLAAQLQQESGWNPSAVSSAGAIGLAQFMPGTWATHGRDADGDGRADPRNPIDAIWSAAGFNCALKLQLQAVPGDPVANILAGYNAGPGAVLTHGGIPPYRETQDYVGRILRTARTFTGTSLVTPVAPAGTAAVVRFAFSKLGTPYLWGGNGGPEDDGRFDCSGLTQAAWATVGVVLPRVSRQQWYAGSHPSRAELAPGDLVFFADDITDPSTIHHVGLYVGNGFMINAPRTGAVIRFAPIDRSDYIGAVRPSMTTARSAA